MGTLAADDATVLGFDAEDVVDAASVATTGVAPSDLADESWSVSLLHTFTPAGDAVLVDFGAPVDPACPSGSALLVPASYTLSGTVNGWTVEASEDDLSLVATAATLESVSFTIRTTSIDAYNVVVDAGLDAAVRPALPSYVDPSCALAFAVTPRPDGATAGAWSEALAQGSLSVRCETDGYWGTLLDWTATVQP